MPHYDAIAQLPTKTSLFKKCRKLCRPLSSYLHDTIPLLLGWLLFVSRRVCSGAPQHMVMQPRTFRRHSRRASIPISFPGIAGILKQPVVKRQVRSQTRPQTAQPPNTPGGVFRIANASLQAEVKTRISRIAQGLSVLILCEHVNYLRSLNPTISLCPHEVDWL